MKRSRSTPKRAKGALDVAAEAGQGGTNVNSDTDRAGIGANNVSGTKLTITQMADLLARFTDKPMVDMTDLKGGYTFTLTFTPRNSAR